jgi:tetratricopeptide (TPR) repeat protein
MQTYLRLLAALLAVAAPLFAFAQQNPNPAANPVVLRGHEGPVSAVAISPDNRWLVTGSEDKTARLCGILERVAAEKKAAGCSENPVAAYRSALEVYSKADLPQDWARIQYNLGAALQDLGTCSGAEEGRKLLADAIAAYRSALEVYSKNNQAPAWVDTQNALSSALGALSDQLGGEEGLKLKETGKNLGVRRRYPPVLNDARYTGPVAR